MEEGGDKRIVQDAEWRSLEPPTPVPRRSRRERIYTLYVQIVRIAEAITVLYVAYQWYIGDLLSGVRGFLYYCMSAIAIGCIYHGMCVFYEHVTRNKPIAKVTEIPKGRAAARGAAQLPARK
jgi:hypothetical protein